MNMFVQRVCNPYFNYKLKKNGIDTTPVPIYIEDELVDVEPPQDMLSFVMI